MVITFRHGCVPPAVIREQDGTYTLWFSNADEDMRITGLNKTALTDIKRAITDRQRQDKETR